MSQGLIYFGLFDMLEKIKELCLFYYHSSYKNIEGEYLKIFWEVFQKCESILHQVKILDNKPDRRNNNSRVMKIIQINQAILQGYDLFGGYVLGVDCSLMKQKEGLTCWQDNNPFYFLLNVDDIYLDRVVDPLIAIRLFARILALLKQENSFFYQEYHLKMALNRFFYDELS